MRCYAPDPAVGANSAPQTSWLDFGERKGRKKAGVKERGKRKGRGVKKGKGNEREKEGKGKGGMRDGEEKERGKREAEGKRGGVVQL